MDIKRMKDSRKANVLIVDACLRKEESRTALLTEHFMRLFSEKWTRITKDNNMGLEINTRFLDPDIIRPMDKERLKIRDAFAKKRDYSDSMFDLAHEIKRADLLVISAPCWDLSFPAMLKVYIENIVVEGLTFVPENDFFRGLCNVQETIFITTIGGHFAKQSYGLDYIKGISDMLDLGRVTCYAATGMDLETGDPKLSLETAKREMDRDFITR